MSWTELAFWTILFFIFFGAFDGLKDVIKLWINRRYDAKIAQANASAPKPKIDLTKEF